MIAEGDQAPAVAVSSDDGKVLDLASYRDKRNVVLYFYPKDNTPGCTKESVNFQAELEKIRELDGEVVGVSPDSVASHQRFKDKYGFSFPLLADVDKEVCRSFGVWTQKSMFGKKYYGVQRATFIIGKDGIVKKVWPKVSVSGHAAEVIAALQQL